MARIVEDKTGPLEGLLAFATLGRPLFLAGSLVFYGLGVAAAAFDGVAVNWAVAAWGCLAVAAAQLMNHYSNDYYDLDADLANSAATPWSGGSRVLAERRLHPRVAFWAAVGFGLASVLLAAGVSVFTPAPWASLALLLFGAGLAWVYSGPPLYLHRRGFGEPVGALLIPGLTSLVGYVLQAGRGGLTPLFCALPLCLLQFAMLIAVSVPDAAGDASVGKQTLVVRLGARRGALLYVGAVALAYLTLPLLVAGGLPLAVAAAPLAAAPIALWNSWGALRGRWEEPHSWAGLGFWSIGQLMASGGLMLAALALA